MADVSVSEPSWAYKGWPHRAQGTSLDAVVAEELNLFADDFLFPVATISVDALDHNISTMATFCEHNGVSLAPHAKTTMSPEIIARQIASGSWAITAATASQARTFRQFGVGRILIAHEVVDPAAVRWIANELDRFPDVEIMCLVDSIAAVDAMNKALVDVPGQRPIDVLVELGHLNGRSGCRSVDEAVQVGQHAAASSRLRLVGVEGYEGMIPAVDDDHSGVDEFLHRVRETAERLDALSLFDELDEIVLTAGGSTFPDRVVMVLGEVDGLSKPSRVVIRSGCYVTHDSGMYEDGGPFGRRAPMLNYPPLQAAMTVWSYVVSRPEPDLAILGFGKRDASFDAGYPTPLFVRRNGGVEPLDDNTVEVFSLNDQHAYVRVGLDADLAVGDVVGCGISHPCTTFDKWRAIPLINADYDVVGAIRTFF